MHDYLNQPGGAERVVLEMTMTWPGAPVYTSLYRPESTFPEFRDVDVRTSPLQRLPVDGGFRNLLPVYPLAFRSFGTLQEDLARSHWPIMGEGRDGGDRAGLGARRLARRDRSRYGRWRRHPKRCCRMLDSWFCPP